MLPKGVQVPRSRPP